MDAEQVNRSAVNYAPVPWMCCHVADSFAPHPPSAIWTDAQAAVNVVDTIVAGWLALADFTRLVSADKRRRVLILSGVDYDTWCGLERHNLGPWDALLAGLDLELPTFAEYRARVADLEEGERLSHIVVDEGRSALAGRRIEAVLP